MWLKLALKSLLALLLFSACSSPDRQAVDKLNSVSYAYHYRDIDSTEAYARRAFDAAYQYRDGQAEALNNMAFVSIVRMDYEQAYKQLAEAATLTDNQVELLVTDIQQMRLCQRMSRNREFYDYRERAGQRLRRINEERTLLDDRQQQRLLYAETEMAIVNSTYYYYVGLERQSVDALQQISPDVILRDTAQYLNYLYNIGAGGIITEGTQQDISQQEFDCLLRCFQIARQHNYPYFAANALEAISEHLMEPEQRQQLITDNAPGLQLINPEKVGDDELPAWLADGALAIFQQYGDVYQIAGAYRTLASCYRSQGDYEATLYNLEQALSDERILQAPDLVASIREQLSVAYSAINEKQLSDYNRNIYIDLQEQTRQDRELEARADMYDKAAQRQNWLMAAVVLAILLLLFMLWLFNYLHQRRKRRTSLEELTQPLRAWEADNEQKISHLRERMEEINEAYSLNVIHIRNNERRNLEQRAKVSLVNSIMPFIDRIINEVKRLSADANDKLNAERLEYIRELTDKINEYNDVLTHWIQLRQGELNLHVESFGLQQLFDILGRSKMSFQMKGVALQVEPTTAVVKADKILTLFMLNTLADNARKFTEQGGQVIVSAQEADDYVEIAVQDTGVGMSQQQLASLFDHKVVGGHGFGLMNCRGIIEKYRKVSQIFSVCRLGATSEQGRGSRFYFRLPMGMVRALLVIVSSWLAVQGAYARHNLDYAHVYADSAYFSNINGTYERTLQFADSCRKYLNLHYRQQHPQGHHLMVAQGSTSVLAPEIKWYHDSLQTNYQIILDIRNESAVAALALHQWQLYAYNNKVYTQLFKEMSADNTLTDYCRMMQQSQVNRTIAIIILIIVLLMILPAYYLFYYRHRLYYRFCVERIGAINEVLMSESTPVEKLKDIQPLAREHYPDELQSVVSQILTALQDAVTAHQVQFVNLEIADDERRRAEYEDNNLHVSNAVLDNCLSTLKHETMYYPSRIRQLVDEAHVETQSLTEVVSYYRELYAILSQQAMRQLDHVKIHLAQVSLYGTTVLGDENLLHYLFELLNKRAEDIRVEPKGEQYLLYTVRMPQLQLTDEEAERLFTPAADRIPYLLCRQIVRDHGEVTNRRGCGIMAEVTDGQTYIKITLPRYGQF